MAVAGGVHLANRYVLAADILGGRRVSIRMEEATPDVLRPEPRIRSYAKHSAER